jgi:hypothetical protein
MEGSKIGPLSKKIYVNGNFIVSAQPNKMLLAQKSDEKRSSPGGLSEPD